MDNSSWTAPPGAAQPMGIQSTAGAVPIMNDKGEVSMKKVKVQRYVSGKRPDYAPASSDEEEEEDEDFTRPRGAAPPSPPPHKSLTEAEMADPRLRRLLGNREEPEKEEEMEVDIPRRRVIHQAEVVDVSEEEKEEEEMEKEKEEEEEEREKEEMEEEEGEEEEGEEEGEAEAKVVTKAEAAEEEEEEEEEEEAVEEDEEEEEEEEEQKEKEDELVMRPEMRTSHRLADSDSESEGEVDEEELALRRLTLRQRALQKIQQEEELLGKEEEGSEESSEEESSEYSEETDSEEEGPRLKPVFVRKKDRVTIHQKEQQQQKLKQQEVENRKRIEERRRDTLRLIEQEHRQAVVRNALENADPLNTINTDDEADDAEYEAWKLRELKRLKRDKEEREAAEKEHEEIDKLRLMGEEERRIELRNNPKVITNKAQKGKYKFLQKYYHRGAFFLDAEEEVYKRDFSGATLEDHFDKTILPKVMQVKNFGRSGRTKYTHLVDQDTTSFDSPWAADSQMNHKFFNANAGGMKQMFDRASLKKRIAAAANANASARK